MLRTSVFFVLLAQSMLLQAESAGEGNVVSRAGGPSSDVSLQNRYQQQGFPGWPESRDSAKEMVPPPPPGPYRSTALSDYSVQGRTVSRNLTKPVTNVNPSNIPMETFSPDRPWPEYQERYGNDRYAKQWMPETGVRYTKPPIEIRAYPPTKNTMPAGGHHTYRSAPVMRPPAMNTSGSRRMPSMATTPAGENFLRPYPVPLNYATGYNKPVNREPYPVVGNQ